MTRYLPSASYPIFLCRRRHSHRHCIPHFLDTFRCDNYRLITVIRRFRDLSTIASSVSQLQIQFQRRRSPRRAMVRWQQIIITWVSRYHMSVWRWEPQHLMAERFRWLFGSTNDDGKREREWNAAERAILIGNQVSHYLAKLRHMTFLLIVWSLRDLLETKRLAAVWIFFVWWWRVAYRTLCRQHNVRGSQFPQETIQWPSLRSLNAVKAFRSVSFKVNI